MNIVITPTYHDIYGEPSSTIEDYLSSIDRKKLIEACLLLIYSDEIKKNIFTFCSLFFSNKESAKLFASKIIAFSKPDSVEYQTLIDPIPPSPVTLHSALELLRRCFSLPLKSVGNDELDNNDVESNILKAILLINSDITHIKSFGDNNTSKIDSAYNNMLVYLPYSDFTNSHKDERFINSIVKAEMFFEYCVSDARYAILLEKFLEKYSFSSWMDYLYVMSKLFMIEDINTKSYTKILLDPQDCGYNCIKSILTKLSINWDETVNLTDNIDYKYFREKPVIRLSEDEFIVINKSICADRIYNSIIFEFNSISKDYTIPKSLRIGDIFSDYRTNFSERQMFYQVIQDMLKNQKYRSLSGDECRSINNCGKEPDYYVRNWNDIFLFEFKDALIQGDKKTSGSYKDVQYMIEDKFVHKKNSDNPSAVEQIASNVNKILLGSFEWDKSYKADKIKIYPILVIGDTKFDLPGFSYILNDYFQKELNKRNIDNSRVGNLIVISIDTLLNYRYDFQDKIIKLDKVFDEYYKYIESEHPYRLTKENIMRNAFHDMFSLSDFLKERYKIRSNKSNLSSFINRYKQYKIDKLLQI